MNMIRKKMENIKKTQIRLTETKNYNIGNEKYTG